MTNNKTRVIYTSRGYIHRVELFPSRCLSENNSCWVYRDSKQSHDDANYRPAVLSPKVCPPKDEAARCKYSVLYVFSGILTPPSWSYHVEKDGIFPFYSHSNLTWVLACIPFWLILFFWLLVQQNTRFSSDHQVSRSCAKKCTLEGVHTYPHLSPAWYITDCMCRGFLIQN